MILEYSKLRSRQGLARWSLFAFACILGVSGCDRAQPNNSESAAGTALKESPSDRGTSSPLEPADAERQASADGPENLPIPVTTENLPTPPTSRSDPPSDLPRDDDTTSPAANANSSSEELEKTTSTLAQPDSNSLNPNQVFRPENVGIVAPTTDEQNTAPAPEESLATRSFATIRASESDEPVDLVVHLKEVDRALGDLVTAGSNDLVPKEQFIRFGMRLGEMKLQSGQLLANSPDATEEQKKAGVLAQLIALSHMSGLGDVKSAQDLEALASGLSNSKDADLAHQSRVVLLGFALQSLQNGQLADPNDVLSQIEGLFTRPEDRNFPEFMIAQQAIVVLEQMGFAEAAQRAKQVLVSEYQSSPDGQLRNSAWNIATQGSQALANYNQASQAIGSPGFDAQLLLSAARGLFEAFPSSQTLEEISRSLANIEYSGSIQVSQALADLVRQRLSELEKNAATQAAEQWLDDHDARMALVGKPLDLINLEDLSGKPLDWGQYEGKVVVVDFWASWCIPCLKELPNLKLAQEQFSEQGVEVIGVNMDDDLATAKQFVSNHQLPWRNFRFTDAPGFESAFASRHGIKAIPFVLLLGKDGKVQQLHARGERLIPGIRQALGQDTSLIPE